MSERTQDVLDYIDGVRWNLCSLGYADKPERTWGTDEQARKWWETVGRVRLNFRRREGWMYHYDLPHSPQWERSDV